MNMPLLVAFAAGTSRRSTGSITRTSRRPRDSGSRRRATRILRRCRPLGQTGIDYGVYGVPETFVIDQRGDDALPHAGPLTRGVLECRCLPLVRHLESECTDEQESRVYRRRRLS